MSPRWRCYCHIIIRRRSLATFFEWKEREIQISLYKLWISLFMNAILMFLKSISVGNQAAFFVTLLISNAY